MSAVLERVALSTSRMMEFFSEKELQMQMGSERWAWPLTLVKELIDNALDACESAGIAPQIVITIEEDAVSVADNGPGLPLTVLERSLDYLVRVSDKSYYVSPTRGQLGNALKCVWAAPYVVSGGEHGRVEITTGGECHTIDVTLDRIAQAPRLARTVAPSVVKTGTIVKIHWPQIASALTKQYYNYYKPPVGHIYDLWAGYAAFNPHVSLSLIGLATNYTATPSNASWHKWLPSSPTSPHWYDAERLRALIAAYIAAEQEEGRVRSVREFVAEFAGLSGTAKQKAITSVLRMNNTALHDFLNEQGTDVDSGKVIALLGAMQAESRAPKPAALGIIGADHLIGHLVENLWCCPEGAQYKRVEGEADGVPFVVEAALAWHVEEWEQVGGQATVGLNWSPVFKVPAPAISDMLRETEIDSSDPIQVLIHIACPRFGFLDRGKSTMHLPPPMRDALGKAIASIGKPIKAQKKELKRGERLRQSQLEELRRAIRVKELDAKEAAYQVMEEAYMLTSDNGKYPANARQVMYVARPRIIELTGKPKPWKNSSYFTQKLLPDFIEAHPELTAKWDVVFDDRGHFKEPHTGHEIGIGGIAVREYIAGWQQSFTLDDDFISVPNHIYTHGPRHRFEFVLFIEKEGFRELLDAARIAERYDIAIMSTKGMSVTASRQLVESLSEQGVTILVAHDFDYAGLNILHTLRTDTRRYRFKVRPRVIDIGLTLADARAMGLASEQFDYGKRKKDPRINLEHYGATEEEQAFLVKGRQREIWVGERVELNAMTSPVFIAWLESKLEAAGVRKVVPDGETVERAYRALYRRAMIQKVIDKAMEEYSDESMVMPEGLADTLRQGIEGRARSWDAALWHLASEQADRDRPD